MPTILKVHKYPDPILKEVCREVTSFDSELEEYIANHLETMNHYDYCVGLAASQVGRLQRILTIDVSRARKPQPNNGLLVLINPVIKQASKFKFVREGCLSIPDFTANVKRAMKITVEYQDQKGEKKELSTSNFEAHAIQHEMDHLDGILFLDKLASPATELFRRKRF